MSKAAVLVGEPKVQELGISLKDYDHADIFNHSRPNRQTLDDYMPSVASYRVQCEASSNRV
jgi:hypothetical protein